MPQKWKNRWTRRKIPPREVQLPEVAGKEVSINNCRASKRRRATAGLTLLELLIALSLTALIMSVIVMALDTYMRTLDRRQAAIEESQLARAILYQIANDLRSSVPYGTNDIEEGLAGLEGIDLGGAVGDLLGGDVVGDLLGGSDDLDIGEILEEDSTYTEDLATTTMPPPIPGLYGNQYQLQVDISRLPRVEEYQRVMALDENFALTDIPSDVKTITYYVQSVAGLEPNSNDFVEDDVELVNGLVRRRMDRAVTQFAAANGNLEALMDEGEVIAPEVVNIEFQYWDGVQWLLEWDSEVQEGLPVAVEIRLYLRSQYSNQSSSTLSMFSFDTTDDSDEAEGVSVYRLVVRIPVGKFDMDGEIDNPLEALGL